MSSPDYFSDDVLKNAAFRAEVEQALAREQLTELAHTLSFYWASATIEYYVNYVENLRKTGQAQIAGFLDRWVKGHPFVLGVLESPETAKAGLDQAALEKMVGAKPWHRGGAKALKAAKEAAP
jgi:zinc protease